MPWPGARKSTLCSLAQTWLDLHSFGTLYLKVCKIPKSNLKLIIMSQCTTLTLVGKQILFELFLVNYVLFSKMSLFHDTKWHKGSRPEI